MPVRLATTADVGALVRVINRAYLVETHIFHGDRTNKAEIRERLGKPNVSFLVVDDPDATPGSGALAGAVFVETRGERSYFGMLAVDPDRQGRGLGRQLVEAAEAHGRAAGCEFMDIDVVDQRLELPAFYLAFGYTTTGETPYPNVSVTRVPVKMIHMTKALTR